MTIDERLEALTHTVELLTYDVQKHDQVLQKHEELIAQILEATARNHETIAHLAFIARTHSERLNRLEEGR